VKRRNLSDKRSKRKIVAENRALHAENWAMKVVLQANNMTMQVMSMLPRGVPAFEEGDVVGTDGKPEVVGINRGATIPRHVFEQIETQIGQGIGTLLPDHEANQKKETR